MIRSAVIALAVVSGCAFQGPEAGVASDPDASTDVRSASCKSLPATCGPDGLQDCCAVGHVPGGAFMRSYDKLSDGMFTDTSHTATVSDFDLDVYEVTVGRFRSFVTSGHGTQANAPAADDGAHELAGSGWDPAWNASLTASHAGLSAALLCDSRYETWTLAAGTRENLPINCVTWYEAAAFCAWDGGYLPTEAEWNYAASGGDEQRAYPWSKPATMSSIDCSYANYDLDGGDTYCVPGSGGGVAMMNQVGSESPKGDGRWGQADLGGNAWEWTLDWYGDYQQPCLDCAQISGGDRRVIRGGNFAHEAHFARAGDRGLAAPATDNVPSNRSINIGFRCARPPA